MKHCVLLLTMLLTCGLLSAQILWQDEAILRHEYIIDWSKSSADTPDGGKLVVYTEGGFMHRGVCLQKLNLNGELAWPQPLLIYEDNLVKNDALIFPSSDGNYIIQWKSLGVLLTKVNALGQPLWTPAIITINVGPMYDLVSQTDDQGGIYLLYGKFVTGFRSNIWCQHVSATGQLLTPGDGIELTNSIDYESVRNIRFAAGGGVILYYEVITADDNNYYRFLRMTPDYQVAWSIQLLPESADLHPRAECILSPDATNFTFLWSQTSGSSYSLYMQRFNLDGDLLFPSPLLIDLGGPTGGRLASAQLCSDNGIMMSIRGRTTPNMSHNGIKKYDYNGVSLWGDGVQLPDSLISSMAIGADSDGGASFRFHYTIDYDQWGTIVQHYDSNGQTLFPGEGLVLAHRLNQDNMSTQSLTVSDRVTCIWMDEYQDKYGLYYEMLDLNGNLITNQPAAVKAGLKGNAYLTGTVERENDILAFWRDSRWSFPYNRYGKIYYQIVNPDGSQDMPIDGAALLEDIPYTDFTISPLVLDNGTTLFFFIYIDGSDSQIRAQAVDPQGDVLWGGSGLTIMDFPGNNQVSDLVVSAEGNDVYLAWSMRTPDNSIRTHIQKFVNGIPQWGPTGRMVSSGDQAASVTEIPLSIEGRFISLQVSTTGPDRHKLWLTHIEPDGSLSAGWTLDGIWVDGVVSIPGGMYQASIALSEGILLLTYRYLNGGHEEAYRYSLIDSQGNILAPQQLLDESELDQFVLSIDTNNGFAYTLALLDPNHQDMTLVYNKIGLDGIRLWGSPSPQVQNDFLALPTFPVIIGFDEGGYAIFCNSYSYLYCGYVDPQGSYLAPWGDQPLVSSCSDLFMVEMLNDELYLTWEDRKTAGYGDYGDEIRMQKLANTTVALDDPLVQHPVVNLSCYPNPFNPETTISFSLPSSGKVRLDVYNLRGQLVRSLIDTRLEAGTHSVIWNGKDDSGRDSATGVYLFKLHTAQGNTVRKAMLLK